MDSKDKIIIEFYGKKNIDELSEFLFLSPLEILTRVYKLGIIVKFKSTKPRMWKPYEVEFLRLFSFELSTGQAAQILLRSRYAVYMKARSLGLEQMITRK